MVAPTVGRNVCYTVGADILGVPEDMELVCFLPVGKAADPVTRVKKKPFDQRAWFNGYGK